MSGERKKQDLFYVLFVLSLMFVVFLIMLAIEGVNPLYGVFIILLALLFLSPLIFILRYFVKSYFYYSGKSEDKN